MKNIDFDRTAIGIEFGSTRIKAALVDGDCNVLASGSHSWENRLTDGLWSYSFDDIIGGMQRCYASLKADVRKKYGVTPTRTGCIGISAMMHGFIALGKDGQPLAPFHTWRNNNAEGAAERLTRLFSFHIPARWSIAQFYQAVEDGEKFVQETDFITTLAGFIHYKLTGRRAVGACDASGMFPLDLRTGGYDRDMLGKFGEIDGVKRCPRKIGDILPDIVPAGTFAGALTEEGRLLLDPEGDLAAGIPLCPPEGDAGTGMVATDSVSAGRGSVSAGTSAFAIIVLDEYPRGVYPEIDVFVSPSGAPAAMAHCNNCSSETDVWVNAFAEAARLLGAETDAEKMYSALFRASLSGDADCGGLVACNYHSGENITEIKRGRPFVMRTRGGSFTLADFMRAQLYSAFATLKLGTDVLFANEGARCDSICAHGGLFGTDGVCQKYLAAALGAPVTVMNNAGEGGAWGMAVLARFAADGGGSLDGYLKDRVFVRAGKKTVYPDAETAAGFEKYVGRFKAALAAERAAENVED